MVLVIHLFPAYMMSTNELEQCDMLVEWKRGVRVEMSSLLHLYLL